MVLTNEDEIIYGDLETLLLKQEVTWLTSFLNVSRQPCLLNVLIDSLMSPVGNVSEIGFYEGLAVPGEQSNHCIVCFGEHIRCHMCCASSSDTKGGRGQCLVLYVMIFDVHIHVLDGIDGQKERQDSSDKGSVPTSPSSSLLRVLLSIHFFLCSASMLLTYAIVSGSHFLATTVVSDSRSTPPGSETPVMSESESTPDMWPVATSMRGRMVNCKERLKTLDLGRVSTLWSLY